MNRIPSDASISPQVARILADMQRQIDQLKTARSSEATSVGEGGMRFHSGGSATFEDGGGIEVDEGGDIILKGGALRLLSVDDDGIVFFGTVIQGDETSRGWVFRFDPASGGQVAFSLAGTPDTQFWSLRDHSSNILVSNDADTGEGLARPFLPMPLPVPVGIGHWPSTQEGSFTVISRSFANSQHPWIAADFRAHADAGTTGDVRFMVNGTQVGGTVTVTDGGFDGEQFNEPLPAGIRFGDQLTLELEARRTGGSGDVYGAGRMIYGNRSF